VAKVEIRLKTHQATPLILHQVPKACEGRVSGIQVGLIFPGIERPVAVLPVAVANIPGATEVDQMLIFDLPLGQSGGEGGLGKAGLAADGEFTDVHQHRHPAAV